MKRPQLRIGAVLLALVGGLLGAALNAGPASADEYPNVRDVAVPASGKVTCFGYTGTFRARTTVALVDWKSSNDECFGITPDRTVWHTFPNAGGWQRMGGTRPAGAVASGLFRENPLTGAKVAVVADGAVFYCQNYRRPVGWTDIWYRCND
ncbi:hypothetical protein [Amycolatopsis sp. NPDC059657]|uniref:hypothetical protein n=1 Tax=Amycolatopsis sp. NPDC059657 TaxID=3346899 RepID=UPI00366FAD6A